MSASTDKILNVIRKWAGTFFTIQNVLTFLMFLVIATGLWFGHAMNTIRERTIPVKLEYEGIPDEYCFDIPLPDHVDIRLRDVGQRLHAYSDIFSRPLTFDLTEQAGLKSGELHLTADQIRPRINDLLQGTTRLQEITPEAISATYHINAKKEVEVRFTGQLNPSKQYELTGQPSLNPSYISIYGLKEQIDTISFVETEPATIDDIKDTLTYSLPIAAIEGVQFIPQQVELKAVAERFTEKVLNVPVKTRRVPEGYILRIFPATVEVRVKVAMKDYNSLTDNSITAFCFYTNQTNSRKLDVNLESKSDKIQVIRTYPTSVEYIIEQEQQ